MANVVWPPNSGSGGGASGEETAMFQNRAQAILPQGFGTAWQDEFYSNSSLFSGGANQTVSHLTSGRCGGGKKTIQLPVTAGSFYFETVGNAINNAPLTMTSSISLDPWYVGSLAYVVSTTGNAEIGFCGWYNFVAGAFAATDAASSQYLSFGIDIATSATNLVVRSYQGGGVLQTKVTAAPIEVGVMRRYEMSNDGAGTIYLLVDGVIKDTITDLNFLTFMYNGAADFLQYSRSNAGTVSYVYDWWACTFSRT